MNWWRRSLLLRLTVVQALAVALTLTVLGIALYQVKAARMIRDDHELLHRYADSIVAPMLEGQGFLDRESLAHRVNDLSVMHPELGVRVATRAGAGAGVDRVMREPIRSAQGLVGRLDVLELTIPGEAGSVVNVDLALPTTTRQQILNRYLNIILVGSAIGILTSVVLSLIAIRRWGRRLRQLSAEARQAAGGSRITATHVDTELAELVQAFNGTLDKLALAYRQSESFSADVAHELRSPLATLIGGTQLALSRPRSSHELKEALVSNLEELEHLKTLVNDMLFLARADQGERPERLDWADLGRLADATIDYCGALLDEAGMTVLRVGEARALCNEALIRRAMANLLSNAIQHGDGSRPIELHLSVRSGQVRLWVFNAGSPLPDAVVAQMFDRFYRVNAARSDRSVHHGLGLSIVHAVARMHGGSVFAEPAPDGNAVGLAIPRNSRELAGEGGSVDQPGVMAPDAMR